MRTIIAGSRDIVEYQHVLDAIRLSTFKITEVISGHARGIDTLGERWAAENSVPMRPFPAEWGRLGPYAGRLRNTTMAHHAEALIAIWDGKSPGTKHMIETMLAQGKPTFVHRVQP